MQPYEEINAVKIVQVLDKLGIKYIEKGNYCHMFEDGKLTDGWKIWKGGNCVVDYSKKRSEGEPYAFIKNHLKLSDRQTYLRFYHTFGIFPNSFGTGNTQYIYRNPGSKLLYPKTFHRGQNKTL